MSYEVMEPVIQYRFSLENDNAHIKAQNSSEVKLFDKRKPENTRKPMEG